MSANKKIIPYYVSEYQHWDLVLRIPLGYLEGNATKYITRWRNKNGLEDVKKADHYLEKLIEAFRDGWRSDRRIRISDAIQEVENFALFNNIDDLDKDFIKLICIYENYEDLTAAWYVLGRIMDAAEAYERAKKWGDEPNRPGTPDDGGHHEV